MSNQDKQVTNASSNIQSRVQKALGENRGMTRKRQAGDNVKNIFTYLSALLALFVLGSVVVYIFNNGWSTLNGEMLTNDYWAGNYNINLQETQAGEFSIPADLEEDSYFSPRYGFAVFNSQDASGRAIVEISHIDADSPILSGIGTGQYDGQELAPTTGSAVRTINYLDQDGGFGLVTAKDAETFITTIEAETSEISSVFYQTPGGGVRGSIIATVMLMLVTLLIALPIGVAAAIYLHELAPDNQVTKWMRSAIEMLNGVPSIVFGLMGMTVLFPITALFGATTPNVLLGGLTMAVVLLPVVIRQTEEALKTVPTSLRMGSLALGATQSQTIFKVVLPNALPGILSAALLSISRVIGESAALIYTMGTAVSDNPRWTEGATTLAVQIWSVMSGEQPNFELASAISILILVVVFILNITVRLITNKLNKRWE